MAKEAFHLKKMSIDHSKIYRTWTLLLNLDFAFAGLCFVSKHASDFLFSIDKKETILFKYKKRKKKKFGLTNLLGIVTGIIKC